VKAIFDKRFIEKPDKRDRRQARRAKAYRFQLAA
jgi:hypothetical protein